MTSEEKIKQDLEAKFNDLKGAVIIQRPRRLFVDVPIGDFAAVFDYCVRQMNFSMVSTITGMDEGATLAVVYHLNQEGRSILSLRVHISRENPVIKTVTSYFPSADIYEREMEDLLGIKVDGLVPGNRYPLPDNWPQGEHPLRKDWKPQEAEGKEGSAHA